MKKQITGYITGVINSYSRAIERLKASGTPITSINSFQAFKEEFTDLLDFVIDIQEDISMGSKVASIENFNLTLENRSQMVRIVELEESCENMNEIENNLHKRVKALTENNDSLDGNCNRLMDHNNKLIKVNFELHQCNKNQVQIIRKLNQRNKHL